MRILPNTAERNKINQEIAELPDEVYHSQISLVLDQPMPVITEWMRDIVTDQADIELIQLNGVTPMVVQMRDDAEHLDPEPSMGTILVMTVPNPHGKGNRWWDDFLTSKIGRRFCDFYGHGGVWDIHYGAQRLCAERPVIIVALHDEDTPYAVLVLPKETNPLFGQVVGDQLWADLTFQHIFNAIKELETGRAPNAMTARKLQIQHEVNGQAQWKYVRGMGWDAEIILEYGCPNPDLARTIAESYWRATMTYLEGRPDAKSLKGINLDPEFQETAEPVETPPADDDSNTGAIDLTQEAANDN